jgi:hypothetical protein
MEVRYETLLAAPREVVPAILDFCQLPHDNLDSRVGSVQGGNSGNWRHELSSEDLGRVETITAHLLRYHGYLESGEEGRLATSGH